MVLFLSESRFTKLKAANARCSRLPQIAPEVLKGQLGHNTLISLKHIDIRSVPTLLLIGYVSSLPGSLLKTNVDPPVSRTPHFAVFHSHRDNN
jgi:hypothetical protein